jgi:steroid delta-isomerase-like uncharacterized protein
MFAFSALVPGSLSPAPLAAAQEATPASACAPTSEAENTAVMQAWYDAISAGDADALGQYLAPEVVRHGGGTIPDSRGPEDLQHNFTLYFAAIPDLQSTIQQIVADDDLVAVRAIEHGTQKGNLLGIPASGNEGTWSIFTIYRFECGKIAEYWSQLDDVGRLQQFGAIPQMMPAIAATPVMETVEVATPTVCAETTPEENEAVVQRWYDEVYKQRDFANFDDIIAPNHVRHGLHRDTTGAASRRAAVQTQQTAFPDLDMQVGLLFSEGDLVVSHWTATGTQTGPWQSFAPTGNVITWTGSTLFRVTCGHISEEWAEVDTLGFYQQIGALEWPPATPAADATPVTGQEPV